MSFSDRLSYMIATPEVASNAQAWAGDPTVILPQLAELGYRGVEIQTRDPREIDTGAFRAALNGAGLRPIGLSIGPATQLDGLFFSAPDESVRAEARARMRVAIDFAADLGATVAVGGVRGRLSWAPTAEIGRAWVDEGFEDALEHASRRGVLLVLEPQSRGVTDLFNRMSSALEYVAEHDSEFLAIEADTYHMALEETSVVGALVQAFSSGKLAHVQVADSNRLAPGLGHLNWVDILAVLGGAGYTGWLGVEVGQIPDSAAAATLSQSFLAQVDAAVTAGQGPEHHVPRSRR